MEPGVIRRALPRSAVVVDVSARDGLQALARPLAPRARAAWVRALLDAGIDEVEAGAFVDPRRVPQMAGTDEVFALLTPDERERAWALVPNLAGMEKAARAGVRNVVCLASATETHSRNNLGRPLDDVVARLPAQAQFARREGLTVRLALSVAFGDPDEGALPAPRAAAVCRAVFDAGFPLLTLCDTYGAASPAAVSELLEAIATFAPPDTVGLHLHDTFGNASANAQAGLLGGVARFDASVNGLGGCPFLPGARGNHDTLQLLALLHELGVSTRATPQAVRRAAAACALLLEEAPPPGE